MGLSWFIAGRLGKNKNGKKKLSSTGNIIAIVSVAISIAAIIAAVAISAGFRKELNEKAIGFKGDLSIAPAGFSSDSQTDAQLYSIGRLSCEKKIRELPFVKSLSGTAYRPGLVKTDDQIQGVVFKGVDSLYDWTFFKGCMEEGRLPHNGEILISRRIANMLSFKAGEKMTAYFIGEDVKVRKLTISGIYNAQLEDYDKLYIITDCKTVCEINGWDNRVSCYEVLFKDHNEKLLRERKNIILSTVYDNLKQGENAVTVSSIKDEMSNLFDWLHLLDLNVLIVLILMIAVAGFNMISCILIILFENISRIGIFKSLGMKDRSISKIFLARGSAIVFKGMLWGNAAGLLFCFIQEKYKLLTLNPDNYFVKYVPVHLTAGTVLLTNIISFVAIMLILIIPCRYISKISPAKTLTVK